MTNSTVERRAPLFALQFALFSATGALVILALLHAVDRSLDPAWRMISEYADGPAPWLLRFFFVCWALATWATAGAAWSRMTTRWGRVGVVLVFVSGLGEMMAAVFELHHPLHGVAFALGVPALALGAPIVSHALAETSSSKLRWIGYLPVAALLVLVASFGVLVGTATSAGVPLVPGEPWQSVPNGVVALNGWANRLLVVCYVGWLVFVAVELKKIGSISRHLAH